MQKLAQSGLLRFVLLAFFIIATIETIFVALLICGIQNVERGAAREYALLRASGSVSELADLMREHRHKLDAARKDPENPVLDAERLQSEADLRIVLEKITETCRQAQVQPEALQTLIDSCRTGLDHSRLMFKASGTQADRQKAYLAYLNVMRSVYEDSQATIRRLRQMIQSQRTTKIESGHVLLAVGGVDLLLGAIAAFLLARCISGPIIRLSGQCNRLKTGELIEAPTRVSNEINSLEETFQRISKALHEVERARCSFITLFREMQEASLNRIKNKLDGIPDDIEGGYNPKARLKTMRTNVDSMFHLLDSMTEGLAFNSESQIVIEPIETSSTILIGTAVSAVQNILDKKQIRLEMTAPECALILDQNLVIRVIVNLLANASKFSNFASEVKIIAGIENCRFRCEIVDQGPGLSEQEQARLFRKYSQIDSREKRSGTGLGLLICQRIVEAHGGQIGCRSKKAEGATFWFELPAQFNSNANEAGPQASQTPTASSFRANTAASDRLSGLRSINAAYLTGLFLFFLLQGAAGLLLDAKLNQTSQKSDLYAAQKTVILETQELLASFLAWRQRATEAIEQHNLEAIRRLHARLERQTTAAGQLANDATSLDHELGEYAGRIDKRTAALFKLSKRAFSNETPNLGLVTSIVGMADRIGQELESDFFKALRRERELLDSNYGLASILREDITKLLLFLAIANVSVLFYLLAHTFSIINRVSELNRKAKALAQGAALQTSLPGTDELSLLDRSLCDAGSSLQTAAAQRQELLSIVNHDLRSPLCSIQVGLELIKATTSPSPETMTKIEDCERELKYLIKHVNNILEIECLEAGKLEPDVALLCLNEAVEDLIPQIMQELGMENFTVRFDEDLPDLMIMAELVLLKRALTEILDNAVKASRPAPVEIFLSARGSKASLEINDHGPGISGDLMEQIFERHRVLAGGIVMGLGLPLARRLLQLMGAELTIVSRPGEGCKAIVNFQLADAALMSV